ncbi:Megakaryocyte-associated tyrosine-protein kinase [Holothuria leucospilota]|uniref:Megakaryocyte-associated tyrosine-protein kinase n=1 Tax=Holothuria leucospilota TaxID=206669 RepID=A0A9Q1H4D8_HOLLE|nr:Megakaryocyte-associated tyrosine-protein kinase [Holothuria leucospilota]
MKLADEISVLPQHPNIVVLLGVCKEENNNKVSLFQFCYPALSARKVLLGTDRICKLYDIWPFGLAPQQIKRLMDKKNPPTPWIAPETIFIEQYNDKSDVWSFGVFLWELYSFGEIPYKSMTREEIEQELRYNQHLKLPRDCPGAISNLILSSWNKDSERRPSFTEMFHELQSLRHYSLEVEPDLPTKMSMQQKGNEIVEGVDQHTYFTLNAE